MPLRLTCPGCDRVVRVPDRTAGQTLECPACGTPFIVPADLPPEADEEDGPPRSERRRPRRTRADRDDDEDDPRPRKKGGSAGPVIAGVGIGVVVLAAAAVAAVLLARGGKDRGAKKPDPPAAEQPAGPAEATRQKAGLGTFTLGPDTTRVTGPLTPTGHVDYVAALNEHAGRGVTPRTNAAVLLWEAVGPRPGAEPVPAETFRRLGVAPPPGGGTFVPVAQYAAGERAATARSQVDRAGRAPWTPAGLPTVAAWLDANDGPLSLAVEASKRPHYYSPLARQTSPTGPAALFEVRLPLAEATRVLVSALTARAMLRAGQRQYDEAWADVLACYRLGRLVGRGGAIAVEAVLGAAIEIAAARAAAGVLDLVAADRPRLERYQRDLQALPPPADLAAAVDVGERYMFLDTVMTFDAQGVGFLNRVGGGAGGPLADAGLRGIDWDPTLRAANRWFDRIAGAMRGADRAARAAEFDRIDAELRALATAGGAGREAVGNVLLSRMLPSGSKLRAVADRTAQTHDTLLVGFALARYRVDHARYPDRLDDLAPTYLPRVPTDRYTGGPLVYQPGPAGFAVYSVGPNGRDDGGRTSDGTPPGDDVGVRLPAGVGR